MKVPTIVPLALLAVLLTAAGSAFAHEETTLADPPTRSFDRIARAVERGDLSPEDGHFYKILAIRDPSRLPAAFLVEGAPPLKCATPIFEDAREATEERPRGDLGRSDLLRVRPTLPAYIDTQHFRIHYSTSGGNAIHGWPNTSYRDAVAAACETSWSFYHAQNDWEIPPSDGGAGGGSGLIDCYVDALNGVYGYAQSESPSGEYPGSYTAFFVIDNDYDGFGYPDRTDPMKVTVAHEYHHVVQMGLRAGTSWWMENTSTFMEDEVYDEINDNYNYLNCYFGAPYRRLTYTNGCFEYACFIWPTYLKENWSHAVVRDVWNEYATTGNLYDVFDLVLAPYGFTLDTAVAEWANWNVFTGNRADDEHYIEGGPYNRYVNYDNSISTFPQYAVHPSPAKEPEGLGANFTKLVPEFGSSDNVIEVTYRAPSCSYESVIWFSRKLTGQQECEQYPVEVDDTGTAGIELDRWDETEWMFMTVPMKRACGALARDFEFDVVTSQEATDVEDRIRPARVIRLDQNQPNPFNPTTRIRYALGEPLPVRLEIFDASGRHVRTLVDGLQSAGEHAIAWFGEDDRGRAVPTGLYFYSLRAGEETRVRKMLLVE
ncbi:MAG: hypothetical protein GF346_10440 [Candidatus Eisenbacteria bacterium]|nr:hypothetical protein [Candidatus Latescibacterota bacterium]MBD3302854.1 hypothetical protein [Candidatus Eisenbacteria bacterium]